MGPRVQQHPPNRASFCRHCNDGSGFEFAATAVADTMSAFTTVSLFRLFMCRISSEVYISSIRARYDKTEMSILMVIGPNLGI
ncbi:hypothetical protein OPV22_003207 [Ensete ventricosum]|uniref:Uncharacterized protein n=1 Tax=Ensete ventricosum TaxID=4639 RepID=A0AAV8S051_ENSVE|nr:hypothetical protein OPV22_003207 [Ensete ventricosum]